MKILVAIVLVIVGMVFLGWLTYADSEENATVTINKTEINKDTDEAVRKTKEVLDEAADKTSEALEDAKEGTQKFLEDTGDATKEAADEFEEATDEAAEREPAGVE